MKWAELPRNPGAKTLRQFAVAWLVFFLAWAVHQGLVKGRPPWGIALAALAVVVGVLGLIRPIAVKHVFVGWMILAFPIGWVVSQVTLLFLFFAILTPVALCFRLVGRDALARKLDANARSYWVTKEIPADKRRYFRQY
jgi:hypothetical protein